MKNAPMLSMADFARVVERPTHYLPRFGWRSFAVKTRAVRATLLTALVVGLLNAGSATAATVNGNLAKTEPSAATAPATPAELVVWHSLSSPQSTSFNHLLEDFQRTQGENQKIKVSVGAIFTPLTETQALIAALSAGGLPDMAQLDSAQVRRLRQAGLKLTPLDTLLPAAVINASPAFLRAVPSLTRDAKGKWLSLPMMNAVPVLLLNRAWFEKAGLNADQPPATWRALQGQLIALQAAGASCPLATSWQSWVHGTNLSATHGVSFFSGRNGFATEQPQASFNGTLHMRHLALMRTWVKSRLLTAISHDDAADERFVSGECAMLLSSTAVIGRLRAAADNKDAIGWRMSLVPIHEDVVARPVAPVVSGSAWWVIDPGSKAAGASAKNASATASGTSSADRTAALKTFLSYLVSPVVAAQWHQDTGYLPLTDAAYRASQTRYYDKMPGEAAVLAWVADAGRQSLEIRVPSTSAVNDILDEELDAIWAGTKPPQAGMIDAVRRIDGVLGKLPK